MSNSLASNQSSWRMRQVTALSLALLGASGAQAFSIDSGDSDLELRWDNTVRYSNAWRLNKIDDKTAASADNPNIDDGDRNFGRGLISNRLDLLSEFDARYKRDYGLRVSAAAWYDSVYNQGNDNQGTTFVNSRSVDSDNFTSDTEKLHGRKAEFLDAFAYGRFELGESSLNLKAGQFAQIYGESLFFGTNGIAAAQLSPDVIKATSVPGSQVKEIMMPSKQVSALWQINPDLTFGTYYQLEWRKARLPAAGSYFSFADFVDEGGESLLTPFGLLRRGHDLDAKDSGQGGVQLKYKAGDYEFGLYAAVFHDRFPQFYLRPGEGDYQLVYGENIKTFGTSVSTLIGETNVAAEVSIRHDMPLVATGNTVILAPGSTADNNDHAAYPVGNTLHANFSTISVFPASPLWEGATLMGELAFNRRLSVTRNADALDPNATRDASALRVQFQPEYFQVLPQVDMQVPINIGYGLSGRSSVNGAGFPAEHGGDISIGLKADYQKTWYGAINYTHFYGSAGGVVNSAAQLSYDQVYRDRDFVSLSIQRSF
ncbi:DUF1302 domain-containing protein [Pseudomonas koreensis]|uniref:DUF1302 domain-containing protein n=1 Tax=Pseudomonas koreensis TaxID=198620 RepID=A0A9X2XL43_9PSED|nr:DUF1302 domain-containing protein [Pseudomonas koreensis]MCU7250897.1 DUF1302 domain-containing protein [Pseudomonas koreensis]